MWQKKTTRPAHALPVIAAGSQPRRTAPAGMYPEVLNFCGRWDLRIDRTSLSLRFCIRINYWGSLSASAEPMINA